jgi:autoinducer 2-degrading protein
MHVVLVVVTIKPEFQAAFARALLQNARMSVARDQGCLRFDVSQDLADSNRWVLHEVYEDAAAHQRHRQAEHFLEYDRLAQEAVVEKTVIKGAARHIPA